VIQFLISLHLDLSFHRFVINIYLPQVQLKVLCSMLHIMQGAQRYSPAFVIQYNEVSLGAVDSWAALLKGSRPKCGIH
jgi:hypothetical protein